MKKNSQKTKSFKMISFLTDKKNYRKFLAKSKFSDLQKLIFFCSPTEQKLHKMKSSSNLRQGSFWIDKRFETINQEFTAQGRKYHAFFEFWNLLKGAQSQEFSRMRAQFLLCPLHLL